MAVTVGIAPHEAEADAEVSHCVSHLMEAFTNGLNIFRRLRERRRKRKARKQEQLPEPTTDAEHQLSRSLRRGPTEIAEKYAECYHGGMGPRFAKGDSIAHASLAETLIKLNTGLVGIITTFLNHDYKSGTSHLKLDYKSLTNLSDASRRDALQSMTQLYRRLSQSQLNLNHPSAPACAQCGSAKHFNCVVETSGPTKEKKKGTYLRQKSSGSVVTRMPIKSSSQPQLVVMRPKNTRKTSNPSNVSTPNKSPSSSRYTSPTPSPVSMYVPVDPFELQTSGIIKGTLGGGPRLGRGRVDSFDVSRPSKWQHEYMGEPGHLHCPAPELPRFMPAPKRLSPQEKMSSPSPTPAFSSTVRRRLDKVTPSSYTFASDSTKLGEIPQHNWTRPWDYDEAERLNAEAAVSGHPSVVSPAVGEKVGKKKGMFKKFMSRGSVAGAVT